MSAWDPRHRGLAVHGASELRLGTHRRILMEKPEGFVVRELRLAYRAEERMEKPIRSPEDVARLVEERVGWATQEHFAVLMLDGRHRVVAYQIVSVGTATSSLVHPREVFQGAVATGAVGIIVTHTHPSGEPSPSSEDWQVTGRLRKAGRLLGIEVLDHVVLGQGQFVSMRTLPRWAETEPKE